MKKTLRMLVCLVGGATLFGMGCGGAPEEMPAEPVQQPTETQRPTVEPERWVHQQGIYMVCWGELGGYEAPSTSSWKLLTFRYGHKFETTSQVFASEGEYWVRGHWVCTNADLGCWSVDVYVRWAGLC